MGSKECKEIHTRDSSGSELCLFPALTKAMKFRFGRPQIIIQLQSLMLSFFCFIFEINFKDS